MDKQKLTKRQAAIVGAYTGFSAGPFGDVQLYADEVLGRPTWTHEFASQDFADQLREAAREDFLAICYEESDDG